ncbi:uroporphyrinogen decarboxylase [Porphyromonadaceae bacterium COT-184 OH4590]|nr:uroporphyrinogen decarboxylase [Porphyromonadaceae bacterium COT-184 OH4590]
MSAWLAPTFVIISFLLKNIKQIRTINLIGCIFFVIYGILKGMLLPIIIPNGILACIQMFFLIKGERKTV